MSKANAPAGKRKRDVRLDFFRGLCLFIIFMAHMIGNPWADWIPAKFGFSDATEIFVFCSGMASAIAFGSVFRNHGYVVGIGRIAFRVWQVYWAHISVFMVTLVCMIMIDWQLGGDNYIRGLMMQHLLNENAQSAIVGLFTLTFVPPYFDILPMYLVILLMLPIVVALAQVGRVYAAAFIVGLWLISNFNLTHLPREPWGDDVWFFNPFAWQLIFFSGFAFMRGWLPPPPTDRRLIWAAVAVLVLSVPFDWWPLMSQFQVLQDGREALGPLINKTNFGILRFVHFLSLAYLSYILVGEEGRRLTGPLVRVICKVGQQSLGVFIAGLVLSFLAATFLNVAGSTYLTVPLANLGGFAILIAIAYGVAWFKSAPWSKPAPANTAPAPGPGGIRGVARQDGDWSSKPSPAE
ncbi:MAG: OpgC family protein [Hyphomicrobiaceae bacterium]